MPRLLSNLISRLCSLRLGWAILLFCSGFSPCSASHQTQVPSTLFCHVAQIFFPSLGPQLELCMRGVWFALSVKHPWKLVTSSTNAEEEPNPNAWDQISQTGRTSGGLQPNLILKQCQTMLLRALPCLETLQELGLHSLTRQPVLIADGSHKDKDFLHIQTELFLFQLVPVASHPPGTPHCKGLGSIFSETSSRSRKAATRSSQTHLFSRLNHSTSLSLSARVNCSSPWPSWWLSAELGPIYISRVVRPQSWTTDVGSWVPRKGDNSWGKDHL